MADSRQALADAIQQIHAEYECMPDHIFQTDLKTAGQKELSSG